MPLREDLFAKTELEEYYKGVYGEDDEWNTNENDILEAYERLVAGEEEKPTIAVMDNESHFNITRGASFESIIFRGDYGMLADTSDEADKSTVRKCEVIESEDLLSYNAILLDSCDVSVKCEQVYF